MQRSGAIHARHRVKTATVRVQRDPAPASSTRAQPSSSSFERGGQQRLHCSRRMRCRHHRTCCAVGLTVAGYCDLRFSVCPRTAPSRRDGGTWRYRDRGWRAVLGRPHLHTARSSGTQCRRETGQGNSASTAGAGANARNWNGRRVERDAQPGPEMRTLTLPQQTMSPLFHSPRERSAHSS